MKFAVGQRWKNHRGDVVVIECIDGSIREGRSSGTEFPVFAGGKSFTNRGRYFANDAVYPFDLVELLNDNDPQDLNYSLLVLSGQPIYSLPSN